MTNLPGIAACEGLHDNEVPAVAIMSMTESCSMANGTTLCGACLQLCIDEFLDEQATGQSPEPFEIRPLANWPEHTEYPRGLTT